MSQCPHGIWHRSQCPYCLIESLRRQLLVAKAEAAAARRDFDLKAGEVATLRYQLGCAKVRAAAFARERQKRFRRRRAEAEAQP